MTHTSRPVFANGLVTLYADDCFDMFAELGDDSIDAVVTDPPYALDFLGHRWDRFTPGQFQNWCEKWAAECLRVLKPGGHMLAFGGTRTWHRLTSGIEDAGFEIRDSMAWLHSNGMPKSKNSMKPAFEPIVVARKLPIGSIVKNVSIYGTGALNIDAARTDSGRWPANVLLDGGMADLLDEQTAELKPGGAIAEGSKGAGRRNNEIYGVDTNDRGEWQPYGDSGGASRFFPVFRYQAKAMTKERPRVDGIAHPTVKPLALIEWLVKLVASQNPNTVVLDPFAGSGTTVEACLNLGVRCIAGEREETYIPLIMERIGRVSGSFPVK